MSETDFIRGVARRTGCGLLLDVNNVFVSATNHGFSRWTTSRTSRSSHVGEIHLAGHAEQSDDEGEPLLIDSHDAAGGRCASGTLIEIVVARAGPIPTLIEWDSNLPEWPILKAEAAAAQAILDRRALRGTVRCRLTRSSGDCSGRPLRYAAAFPPALTQAGPRNAVARDRPEREARHEALQRISQRRHREPH